MKAKLPLSSGYSDTRRPASEQRVVNMYPHTREGFRQFPGLSLFASAATSSVPVFNQSQSVFSAGGTSLVFKSDGTKVISVLKGVTDYIQESTLSSAWDISTAGSVTQTTLTYPGSTPNGIAIKSDGTKAYVADAGGSIYQFSMTSWDTTTISYDSVVKNISAQSGSITGLAFNSDGTKLYVLDAIGDRVLQYTLSTGWNLATATYDNKVKTITETSPWAISVSPSNDKFWVVGASTSDAPEQYYIADPGDISASTFTTTFDCSSEVTSAEVSVGVAWGNSGSKLYILDNNSKLVHEYDAATAYSFGGETAIARGMKGMDGVLYAIYDNTLYSIDGEGDLTSIGTIDGTGRVVMETDGTHLVITTGTSGNKIYVYTTAGGLSTVTDGDIVDSAKSSAYLDLRFWFDQPDGKFRASEEDDPTSFDALDVATAESFSDDILREFGHNQRLYHFGGNSIEVDRTGTGRPPSDRQAVIERGVIGTHAVDSIDDTIFFVDQFRRPNMMSGLQYHPIYTPAIADSWDEYESVSDCVVDAFSYRQSGFVYFLFPAVRKSWVYHVPSGKWSELENTSGSAYSAVQFENVYGKTLVQADAKVLAFAEDSYQYESSSITRTLHTDRVSSELIGADTRDIAVNGLWLTIESTGSGSVSVSFAKNGGAFGTAKTLTVAAGVNTYPLATPWGRCTEGVFQITTTANAGIDIIDALVDVTPINV